MIVLGIESSCDETACAVVRDGLVVLSNVVASQNDLHAEYGGVVPEIASRAHVEHLTPVVRAALREAGVTLAEIGAVAVGHRPGLIGCLLVGVAAAKALAWSLGVPLVGVDHVHAHLYAGLLTNRDGQGRDDREESHADSPVALPALGLVVSGGHTSIYVVGGRDGSLLDIERLGATIDDAMGEAYDKAAAILGLGFPGGPRVDALACEAGADERAFDLPISRLGPGSLDFSYSGLKTALLYAAHGGPAVPEAERPVLTDQRRRDLAASFQRAAVAAITLKLGRAVEHLRERGVDVRTLLAGGGVTANSRLRTELATFAAGHGLGLVIPPMALCVDNAAMIAGLGSVMLDAGHRDGLDLAAVPTTAC
ncbi:MAG: tRNA (adenosine(37)-N6)-threonylcarbamoyltransferase complex transferase subunit TsaD [Phycisphaeraceae bacterium]|nr:tRNA (adenosine(37)-N6)-threonylcarbamoyltransferase complex transferase subunit TsaD [Phycisphaeraceae bacterium]